MTQDRPEVFASEPIAMPRRDDREAGLPRIAAAWARRAGQGVRWARLEARRTADVLRSARTEPGRRRNLPQLLVLAAAGGFLLGVVAGLRRHR